MQQQIPIPETENAAPKAAPAAAPASNGELSHGEKFLAAIGYMGPLCVLPLCLKQDSEFCQLHGKQALIIFLFFFLVTKFFSAAAGLLFMFAILHIAVIVICFVQAFGGNRSGFPVLSDMAKKLKW